MKNTTHDRNGLARLLSKRIFRFHWVEKSDHSEATMRFNIDNLYDKGAKRTTNAYALEDITDAIMARVVGNAAHRFRANSSVLTFTWRTTLGGDISAEARVVTKNRKVIKAKGDRK